MGAPSSTLERHYSHNSEEQIGQKPVHETALAEIRDPQTFGKYLADREHYRDYLEFFTEEIEKKGQTAVLEEYLFRGDERANDMLVRLLAGWCYSARKICGSITNAFVSGFLHPLIHLGYGMEWNQPAIVAEALGQTATHDNWIGKFLLPAEEAAKSRGPSDRTLISLLEEAVANKKLKESPHWSDNNKIRDGIIARAPQEMIDIAAQWTVQPHELERKTAQMINFAAYFTGAALRSGKAIKFDFYHMHCLNASLLTHAVLSSPDLSPAAKCRLLEWKGRVDLCMYISRNSPPLHLSEIREYPAKDSWERLFERIVQYPDDGHASKFVRAVAHGEAAMRAAGVRDGDDGFPLESGDWLKLGNMVVDSVEAPGPNWVRSAGFDEAWER
jgi:hypothetical protein